MSKILEMISAISEERLFHDRIRKTIHRVFLYSYSSSIKILFLIATSAICHAESISNEYQVKAAFLYNLARMVEWPDEPVSSPIVICFYGEDFFGNSLESIEDKKVRDRALVFRKNITLGDVKQCHVLFISRSESTNLISILSSVNRLPLLTVGDTERFSLQGGIVNLVTQNNKINIEINLRAAKDATLKISSRLLSLADIVAE